MIQITNSRNFNWSNLTIIYASNVYMPLWGNIDDSDILTIDPSISTPVNQLLIMCAIVSIRVDKCSGNLKIQFSINGEIFHPVCRIWIGVRE